MANIGVGETYHAWLIEKSNVQDVNSYLNELDEAINITKFIATKGTHFKYRYLSQSEMTYQPISNHLKGKFDSVIFTSETNIKFKERQMVVFEDGTHLLITRKLPQTQINSFAFTKKPPHILELE